MLNCVFSKYRYNAKKREIEFSITREQFTELALGNCHYCGAEPSNKNMFDSFKNNKESAIYNGIDRLSSSLGYVEGNVVSCCKYCNTGKLTSTAMEFIERCKAVAKRFTTRR